jgi:hypothetical protein
MATFHNFPRLPKELRLKIYAHTFEPRILQLGVDAGVPFPPEVPMLGTREGLPKQLQTRSSALLAVCTESRDLCKSVLMPIGMTYIHPVLDTLYISLYSISRMKTSRIKTHLDNSGSSQQRSYSLSVFETIVVELGTQDIPDNLTEWKQRPKTSQTRNGVKALYPPRKWPATDYAEVFYCFGYPRNIEIVSNAGKMLWTGGFSKTASWGKIILAPSEIEEKAQENLIDFLRHEMELREVSRKDLTIRVVEAYKLKQTFVKSPFAWREWLDYSESWMWE